MHRTRAHLVVEDYTRLGENLYLDKIAQLCDGNGLGHAFAKVPDAINLRKALSDIAQDCRKLPDLLPLIHIESHDFLGGGGLVLSSAELFAWATWPTNFGRSTSSAGTS